MAELMERVKTQSASFNKGDIIKGKITKLTPPEILVDVNAKAEAVVLEKDKNILRTLLSTLKVGDEVQVSVLNVESDTGNPVVSLRRFVDDRLWDALFEKQKAQTPLDATLLEITKGGFLVEAKGGIAGFLPNSQTTNAANPQELIGKATQVYILELQRKERKIIFSQKPLLKDEEFKEALQGIKTGGKVTAVITAVTSFGLFVSVKSQKNNALLDGLVHISEIAWERTEDAGKEFSVGQQIEASVVRIDYEAKRIDLSIRRLTIDPFEEIAKRYPVDHKVKGTVTKVLSTGIVVTIADTENTEGFIRKEKIPPTVTYEVGKAIEATVAQVDARRHRVVLVPVLKEKPIGYR